MAERDVHGDSFAEEAARGVSVVLQLHAGGGEGVSGRRVGIDSDAGFHGDELLQAACVVSERAVLRSDCGGGARGAGPRAFSDSVYDLFEIHAVL